MAIEFDPAKDAANVAKHGVSLARTGELLIWAFTENSRPEESERRFRLYGLLDGEAVCAVVSWREETVRAISLRKANRKERKIHGIGAEDR
ncbi:MAG: BrnT family toxin [Allosphingosinicella sp.]